MLPISQDDASLSGQVTLAQMVFAPLAGQIGSPLGSQFVIAEWSAGGSSGGPPQFIAPLHVHYHDDEAWYLLEGKLAFRLGNEDVEATAGTLLFAPHGTPHTYWNPSPEPARYLLIMTPTIRRLIEALHATPDRTPQTLDAIFQEHDSAILR